MKRQSGVALITAVMVVAFASTVAAAMMVQQNLVVHRSANLFQHDQAWWYLIGLEEWAATLLDRDREDNEFDHPGELWAQPIDFLPVDEGALAGRIVDWQGRFNLHNLLDATGQFKQDRKLALIRLLGSLESVPAGRAEELATAIGDWIDPDTEPGFPGGAEDNVYLSREEPYRAANRPLASLSELRLVEGMTPQIYAELLPNISLYPAETAINVNTAPLAVLLSLSEQMTAAQAQALMEQRLKEPFETVDAFVADPTVAGMQITSEGLTVKSHYFLAEGSAHIGNVRLHFVSLLERAEGRKTRVVAHSRNTL